MGYIDSNLMKGERVVYRTRLHRIAYFRPAIILAAAIAAELAVPAPEGNWAGLALLAVAAAWALPVFVRVNTSEFGVTDKRVIIKVGWIRRETVETLLGKVEAVEVRQSILGRIFNYGTIVISGTGGTKSTYDGIRAPLDFRRNVHEQTTRGG